MKLDDKDAIEAATTKLTEAAQVIYQQAAAEAEAEARCSRMPALQRKQQPMMWSMPSLKK